MDLLTGILRKHTTGNTDTSVPTYAYKQDETTDWESWFAPIDDMLGVVSNITGPTAPHYYMFVRREDLDLHMPTHANIAQIEIDEFPEGIPRHPDDVMCIVKNRISDDEVTQVLAMVPAHMDGKTRNMPSRLAPRNPVDKDMRKKISTIVPQLLARNLISTAGADYLLKWLDGTLPKHPRPEYRWLQHHWKHVAGLPEAKLSNLSGVDVLRDMKRVRCNWKIQGFWLNCSETFHLMNGFSYSLQ